MSWLTDWKWPDARATIAVTLVVGVVVLIVTLIVHPSALDAHPAVMTVLTGLVGLLSACLTTVVQYYFGSSAESKAKGEVIAGIAMAAPPAVPPPKT